MLSSCVGAHCQKDSVISKPRLRDAKATKPPREVHVCRNPSNVRTAREANKIRKREGEVRAKEYALYPAARTVTKDVKH